MSLYQVRCRSAEALFQLEQQEAETSAAQQQQQQQLPPRHSKKKTDRKSDDDDHFHCLALLRCRLKISAKCTPLIAPLVHFICAAMLPRPDLAIGHLPPPSNLRKEGRKREGGKGKDARKRGRICVYIPPHTPVPVPPSHFIYFISSNTRPAAKYDCASLPCSCSASVDAPRGSAAPPCLPASPSRRSPLARRSS